MKLSEIQRRDIQDVVDELRAGGLSPPRSRTSDPLRVIFRSAIRRELAVEATDNLDLRQPATAAIGSSPRACGLRRGNTA